MGEWRMRQKYLGQMLAKAAIALLKDWRDMEWKLENGMYQAEEIETRLTSTTSRAGSTPVSGGGGNRVEQAMAFGISAKDAVLRGIEDAKEYFDELRPAWERLNEDDQYCLTVRFVDHEEGDGVKRIMDRYYVSKREAYNMSNDALKRFVSLLYWTP